MHIYVGALRFGFVNVMLEMFFRFYEGFMRNSESSLCINTALNRESTYSFVRFTKFLLFVGGRCLVFYGVSKPPFPFC